MSEYDILWYFSCDNHFENVNDYLGNLGKRDKRSAHEQNLDKIKFFFLFIMI